MSSARRQRRHRVPALGKPLIRHFAAPERQTVGHVARMRAGTAQRQVTCPGQPIDGVRRATSRSGEAGHLGKTAGDNGGAGIVAKPEPDRTAGGNRDHILHGAADGNAKRVPACIDAKMAGGEALLDSGNG